MNIVPTQPFLRARVSGEQGVLSALFINESTAPRIVSGTCVCVCVCVCACMHTPACVCASCQTLGEPMDCRSTGSSVHGIFQARILEGVTISSSRGSSQPRDGTCSLLPLQHWLVDSTYCPNWEADSLATELSRKPSSIIAIG